MTMFYSLVSEIQNPTTSEPTKRQIWSLLRITDLFLAGSARYSSTQISLFVEVLKILVDVIELKTRIKLAQRFANDSNAPAALVRAFASSSAAAVAGPVLSQSTALSDADLIASASTASQDHLYAIAQRQSISEAVTDVLIEYGEQKIAHAVAKNEGARISDGGFEVLVRRSGDDNDLAVYVGSRRDIPRHHLVKLLETASASACSRIIKANAPFAEIVQEVVTEVVDDINIDVRNNCRDHKRARNRVKRLTQWKELEESGVHSAARAQDFERTATALSFLAECPIETAERAILNRNPGAVLILAKAAGCSWATAKALLQMTVANRKMSAPELDVARENFGKLQKQTAHRVLEFYKHRRTMTARGSFPFYLNASANSEVATA